MLLKWTTFIMCRDINENVKLGDLKPKLNRSKLKLMSKARVSLPQYVNQSAMAQPRSAFQILSWFVPISFSYVQFLLFLITGTHFLPLQSLTHRLTYRNPPWKQTPKVNCSSWKPLHLFNFSDEVRFAGSKSVLGF